MLKYQHSKEPFGYVVYDNKDWMRVNKGQAEAYAKQGRDVRILYDEPFKPEVPTQKPK